jgi:hypothetical protein
MSSHSIRTNTIPPLNTAAAQRGHLAVAAAFLALSVSLAVQSAAYFDHNDSMYAASAVRGGRLYDDVHYVQAPFGFWFWQLVARLAPEGHIYLTLRVASLVLVLVSVGVVVARILPTPTMRLLFILTVAASDALVRIGGEIGTYSLALCLVVLGLAMLVSGDRGLRHIAAAGLCFGLAAGAKLNHLLLMIPVLPWLLHTELRHHDAKRAAAALGLFGAGALVGLLPVLAYMAVSWQAFLLHNLYFHTEITNAFRGLTALDKLKSLYDGLLIFLRDHAVLLAPAAWIAVRCREGRALALLWLGGALVAVVMAATPMVMYPQYLAPASLFSGIAFCHAMTRLSGPVREGVLWAVGPLLALLALHGLISGGYTAQVHGFEILKVEAAAAALRERAQRFDRDRPGCSLEVFSLSGALAVDSGFTLTRYTEAGVFWARLDGFVPDRYIRDPAYAYDSNLVRPVQWVRAEGIDFLITGYYPKYEVGLVSYAEEQGFAAVVIGEIRGQKIHLLYRPDCLVD